ncbi:unnamed protein product [Thelazia callipaeda]|uniref:Zf-3CxxC domain-containing protein n=1 Tax=Thelazia callipaeda TaxID=103827 RepID=A0A0N5CS39_THECL|nr:unnamed protein product [Thelazia callipaeda]
MRWIVLQILLLSGIYPSLLQTAVSGTSFKKRDLFRQLARYEASDWRESNTRTQRSANDSSELVVGEEEAAQASLFEDSNGEGMAQIKLYQPVNESSAVQIKADTEGDRCRKEALRWFHKPFTNAKNVEGPAGQFKQELEQQITHMKWCWKLTDVFQTFKGWRMQKIKKEIKDGFCADCGHYMSVPSTFTSA